MIPGTQLPTLPSASLPAPGVPSLPPPGTGAGSTAPGTGLPSPTPQTGGAWGGFHDGLRGLLLQLAGGDASKLPDWAQGLFGSGGAGSFGRNPAGGPRAGRLAYFGRAVAPGTPPAPPGGALFGDGSQRSSLAIPREPLTAANGHSWFNNVWGGS